MDVNCKNPTARRFSVRVTLRGANLSIVIRNNETADWAVESFDLYELFSKDLKEEELIVREIKSACKPGKELVKEDVENDSDSIEE